MSVDPVKLYQMIQALESRTIQLENHLETLNRLLDEATLTTDIVKGLEGSKNSGALFTLGAGIYLKSRVPSEISLVADVGARVMADKTPAQALDMIEERVKNIQTNMTAINKERQASMAKLDEAKAMFEHLGRQEQAGRQHSGPQAGQSGGHV